MSSATFDKLVCVGLPQYQTVRANHGLVNSPYYLIAFHLENRKARDSRVFHFDEPNASTLSNGLADQGRNRLIVNFVFSPGFTSTST